MPKKKIILYSLLLSFITVLFIAKLLSTSSLPSTIYNLRSFLPYLLGQNKPTTYLILLGNDTETRANGGFTGSYTKITINTPNFDFLSFLSFEFFRDTKLSVSFHDIYVPTGQLNGFVKPPDAIQQAFGKGSWDLSNADFEPDFPSSATTIRWFLEKGKEVNPNILGIVNLSTIKKILNVLGEIKLADKNTTLTPDNIYLYLQGKAELGFFPGSTQKADALHSVGSAAIQKLKSLSTKKKIQIAKIIYQDLKNQNIVLNSTNQSFQKYLEQQKLAGSYTANTYDYYSLVEMNLGANKANQYVTRQTTHNITTENNQLKHEIVINFQNSSSEKNPNPPLYYGGNYLGFFRIYLPNTATNINITHSQYLQCNENNKDNCYEATASASVNQSILENQTPNIYYPPSNIHDPKFTVVSFWHLTLAGQHSQINLSYSLPSLDPKNYSLTILKQNGFPTSPQILNIFSQSHQTSLSQTYTFPQ